MILLHAKRITEETVTRLILLFRRLVLGHHDTPPHDFLKKRNRLLQLQPHALQTIVANAVEGVLRRHQYDHIEPSITDREIQMKTNDLACWKGLLGRVYGLEYTLKVGL